MRVLIRVCRDIIVLIGPVKHPVLVYFSLDYFFTVFVLFTSYVVLILICVMLMIFSPLVEWLVRASGPVRS